MKRLELTAAGPGMDYVFERARLAATGGARSGLLPERGNETLQNVERSLAYMREHLNQPLQVATLAALANVSPSHFYALFKQLTGLSPMDYFTRLRMRHACRLLDSTPASVKEVAAALGYDDPFYFSRVFKTVNQVPPSQYRRSPASLANLMENRSRALLPHGENSPREPLTV